MAAERWLFQETSDKLMVFDSHYIFLLERASSVYSSGYSSASSFLPVRHVSVQPSALDLGFPLPEWRHVGVPYMA